MSGDTAIDTPPPARAASAPPRAECRIDLGALRHNVRVLESRLEPGTRFWAVVKANAYGHDVEQVAEAAVTAGVKRLCVATLSEAWHLRGAGIRVPLLIMGPLDQAGIRRAVDLDVSITVLSRAMLDSLEAVSPSRTGRQAKVHLKVDTGMGRWGLPIGDAGPVLERLDTIEGVDVEGVMTHLATADDESDHGFFDRQLDDFEDVVALARDRYPGVIAHAANSAALVRDSRSHFDAVRCGIAMYGMSPQQRDPDVHDLRPVMSLRSYVADVRRRVPGESVGYSRTWVADSDALVAEVPIGYADGVRRALSNTGEALVGGHRRRFIGNVSMDHLTLLVDGSVQPGDIVTILGSDQDARVTAEDHAAWSGTINYEITCGIAGEPRLLRTHLTA